MPAASGNGLGKMFILNVTLGLSIGVLIATIYIELFGMDFILGCNTKSSFGHESGYRSRSPGAEDIPFDFNDAEDQHHKGGDVIAKALEKKVKILCWVLTSQDRLQTHGRAVKDTWGKRCTVLLFLSNQDDKEFGAVSLQSQGVDMGNMWSKTRAAWRYVYNNHKSDADWFLKADDDSYVIVENLRLLLSGLSPLKPEYLGRWFKTSGGYNTESTGYVFSKETLRTFIRALNNPDKCIEKSELDDSNVGKCLSAFGVHPSDSRDSNGRETFHPFAPEYHIIPDAIKSTHWLHGSNKYPVYSGLQCCSENSISFKGLGFNSLYILEYLVYHLKPYGFEHIPKHLLPSKKKRIT